MKKLLGLLALTPMAIAACGSASKNTIVLYTDIEAGDAAYDAVITQFEKDHGVNIVLETGSAYTLATKMAAEIDAGNRLADGFFTKNSMVQNAYSDYFAEMTDNHIDWDALVQGSTNTSKTFAGISYKTRIVATKDTALATDFTLESLFAQDFDTDNSAAVGMRWSGSYMAANLAAYYGAIASQEEQVLNSTRLDDFKADVERNAEAAKAQENLSQGSDGSWNARRMLVSSAKDHIEYAITNTYYFNRIENAQNFDDESLQGIDEKVATQAQWDAMNMYYPDQGVNGMGAYTDFNSGSVVEGTEHGDKIEQLIAAFHETDAQQNILEEKEFYPAVKGDYKRTDTELADFTWTTDDSFKSMNVEIGYEKMANHWDDAIKWIETFGQL